MPDLEDLRAIVETWESRRVVIARAGDEGRSAKSLRDFVETQNAMSRRLISILGVSRGDFFSALAELATNADRIAIGGKLFADGVDRSND